MAGENRRRLDAVLARAAPPPAPADPWAGLDAFSPVRSSRAMQPPSARDFLSSRDDFPAARFGRNIPPTGPELRGDEAVRLARGNPNAPLSLGDVFTETAPGFIPGDGILPQGGPEERSPLSPFQFEPADAPFDPSPFSVDEDWLTSGASRALHGFRSDDEPVRAAPYHIARPEVRPRTPSLPQSGASFAATHALAPPTQEDLDWREAHEMYAEAEAPRHIPIPGIAQIGRPIADAVSDPELREWGARQWSDNMRGLLGLRPEGGDPNAPAPPSIQWDEIMPRTRANIANGMDPGIAALPAFTSVVGDWWNDPDNTFSRPAHMGRDLVDVGVDDDYLVGGYLPDLARGFAYPWLPETEEARQGLNWERARMAARSNNGDGDQAFDASARNAYAGQVGAAGIDAALAFAAPEAIGAGGVRNIGLRSIDAFDSAGDGAALARQIADDAPITLEGGASYPPRQGDILDVPFEEVAPSPQRRFQAAVRDPETGQVYTGIDHAEAIDAIPDDAVRARLDAMYQADPQFGGFNVNGQYMEREEGLASMRDARRPVRVGEQVNRDGSVSSRDPIDWDANIAPERTAMRDLGIGAAGLTAGGALALSDEAEAAEGESEGGDDWMLPAALATLGAGGAAYLLSRGRGARAPMVELSDAAMPPNAPDVTSGAPFRVFHASPHTFDSFDTTRIGSGEGNQKFGHGLYFAEESEVASHYARAFEADGRPSRIYQVDIAHDPSAFLDLHAPLAEQPENIRRALAAGLRDAGRDGVLEQYQSANWSTDTVLNHIGSERAALALRAEGVPGIRYLDSESRDGGAHSYNYVLFDGADANIVRNAPPIAELADDALPPPNALDAGGRGGGQRSSTPFYDAFRNQTSAGAGIPPLPGGRGNVSFNDARLSPMQNKVVEMRRNGFNDIEIADELETSPASVATQASAAKRRAPGIDIPGSNATRGPENIIGRTVERLMAKGVTDRPILLERTNAILTESGRQPTTLAVIGVEMSKVRKASGAERLRPPITPDEVAQMWALADQGLSHAQIGERIGRTQVSVSNWLRKPRPSAPDGGAGGAGQQPNRLPLSALARSQQGDAIVGSLYGQNKLGIKPNSGDDTPIAVTMTPDGPYVLDGYHRLNLAEARGQRDIAVEWVPYDEADIRIQNTYLHEKSRGWVTPPSAPATRQRGNDVLDGIALTGFGGGAGLAADELFNDEAYADDGEVDEDGLPLLPILGTALGAAGAARLFSRGGRDFAQELGSEVGMGARGGRPQLYDYEAAIEALRDGQTIVEAARTYGMQPAGLKRTLDLRIARGELEPFEITQAPRGAAAHRPKPVNLSSMDDGNVSGTTREPTQYATQSYSRLLDEAEALAAENDGYLPRNASAILAERTGYEPQSIKGLFSDLRHGRRVVGDDLRERARALFARGPGRESVNRDFIEPLLEQELDARAITERLNAYRQERGLEPTSLGTVKSTISQMRKRQRNGDTLAAITAAGLGIGGAFALGDEAEAEDGLALSDGRAIEPTPQGVDLSQGQWAGGAREAVLADGERVRMRPILGPDGNEYTLIIRQRPDASTEVLGYVRPTAGPPGPPAPRLGDLPSGPASEGVLEADMPYIPPAEDDDGPEPWLRGLGAIGVGLAGRGISTRLGARGIARDISTVIPAIGADIALTGGEADPRETAALGLLPAIVGRVGEAVGPGVGNVARSYVREAELSMSPTFRRERDAFAATLPDEAPPLRGLGGIEADPLDHYAYGRIEGVRGEIPADEIIDEGWMRGLDGGADSTRTQFLAASPEEQFRMMERAARGSWDTGLGPTEPRGVLDLPEAVRDAPLIGNVRASAEPLALPPPTASPERIARGRQVQDMVAATAPSRALDDIEFPFTEPGSGRSMFGEPPRARAARAPLPPLEERAAQSGAQGAMRGVKVQTMRQIADDLGLGSEGQTAGALRKSIVRALGREFDSTREMTAFLTRYGVTAAALGIGVEALSEPMSASQ